MGKIMVDGKPASGSFDNAEQVKYGDSNVAEALSSLDTYLESDLCLLVGVDSTPVDIAVNSIGESAYTVPTREGYHRVGVVGLYSNNGHAVATRLLSGRVVIYNFSGGTTTQLSAHLVFLFVKDR